MGLVALPEIGH